MHGLFLGPAEHVNEEHGPLIARVVKPVLYNVVCLGAPVALIAVTIPLGCQLSTPATAIYAKVLEVEPLLVTLESQFQRGGFAALDFALIAKAEAIGDAISALYPVRIVIVFDTLS